MQKIMHILHYVKSTSDEGQLSTFIGIYTLLKNLKKISLLLRTLPVPEDVALNTDVVALKTKHLTLRTWHSPMRTWHSPKRTWYSTQEVTLNTEDVSFNTEDVALNTGRVTQH